MTDRLDQSDLTRQELAVALKVSDSTVGRWLAAGLPYTPVGVKGKRFNLAETRQWLREVYPCQLGQTSKAGATSASWSPASAYIESSRKVQLRVMPSN
jgi:hypothetical protein